MIFDTLQQTQPMTMNIDETRWLPILAKKRWYNLNRPLADGWRGTLDSRLAPNATFSVDDPVFWEKISPSIEIADRLLRATITHPLYVNSPAANPYNFITATLLTCSMVAWTQS